MKNFKTTNISKPLEEYRKIEAFKSKLSLLKTTGSR